MKVGDKVYSIKIRPNEVAVITKADIKIKESEDSKRKREIRSAYRAKYNDGSQLIFYGFDIERTVFKVEEEDGQLTLESLFDI